ncbi:fatty acid desaturase 6-like [Branchiostoma lanceolatum]|uniref:FADS6 protein n=1 Tax=Branchiostoma lanceolatum TaxID=7740 RepID=A0A8J9ZP97_BRALA|nr:FADS6 [Branchiostoma lanceolatum]
MATRSAAVTHSYVTTTGAGRAELRWRARAVPGSKDPNTASLVELGEQVKQIVSSSSWWDRYGVDWCILTAGLGLAFLGMYLASYRHPLLFASGMVASGAGHWILANKGAHLAIHNALAESRRLNTFAAWFLGELAGAFSSRGGFDVHIKVHHPHTNVVGLGDSSSFRAPFLPKYVYMFCAPLLVPALSPLISVQLLWGQWSAMLSCIVTIAAGLYINHFLLVHFSGFSVLGAAAFMLASRSTFGLPYIHVNIFQHIGLPMYSQETRPKRIQLMSTGVLNLSRNAVLDWVFGHSLISCHVEHHLFPTLSDNMCFKVRPVVREYLTAHGLPYNEDTYMGRLRLFVEKYEEWMVKLPPITHFVGLQ